MRWLNGQQSSILFYRSLNIWMVMVNSAQDSVCPPAESITAWRRFDKLLWNDNMYVIWLPTSLRICRLPGYSWQKKTFISPTVKLLLYNLRVVTGTWIHRWTILFSSTVVTILDAFWAHWSLFWQCRWFKLTPRTGRLALIPASRRRFWTVWSEILCCPGMDEAVEVAVVKLSRKCCTLPRTLS
mgnify:CR=1 FL=1